MQPEIRPTQSSRRELEAACCHVPTKLSAQLAELNRLKTVFTPTRPCGELDPEIDLMPETLATILGKRDSKQALRQPTERMASCLLRLCVKKHVTQADLLNLHALLTPEAPSGIRRAYTHCEGHDVNSAVYVAPPHGMLNAYMKDMVKFFNQEEICLGWLYPLALSVQIILVHPFVDGNGRMARAAFVLALRRNGIGRETLAVVDRLWDNGCLLIRAICYSVIDDGWRGPLIKNLLGQAFSDRTA